jgi:4-amino-4-deoxy-L-arabinose transferase-like glycosyltransferase
MSSTPRRGLELGGLWPAAALALGAAALLGSDLGAGPIHWDEAVYATIARELATDGRWFPLTYFGELYLNKPPLGFWILRIASGLGGDALAVLRLPAVAAGVALVVLLLAVASRWLTRTSAAFGAIVLLLTPLALSNHALRGATFDAILTLLVTGACAAAVASRLEDRPRLFRASLAFAAVSVGFKGLAGPALAAVVVFAIELVGAGPDTPPLARLRSATLRAAALLAVGLTVWGLWLLALRGSGGQDLFERLVVGDLLRRGTGDLVAAHRQPAGFYLARLVRDFGWTLVAWMPLVVAAFSRPQAATIEMRDRRLARMLLAWPAALLLGLSASGSKVAWYALPVWTGVALGLATGVELALRRGGRGTRVAVAAVAMLLLAGRALEAERHLRSLRRSTQPAWAALDAAARLARSTTGARMHLAATNRQLRAAPPWIAWGARRVGELRSGWPTESTGCSVVLAARDRPIPDFAAGWPRWSEGLGPLVLLDGCGGRLGLPPGRKHGGGGAPTRPAPQTSVSR